MPGTGPSTPSPPRPAELLAQLPGARSQICYSSPSADDRLDEPGVDGWVTSPPTSSGGSAFPTDAHVYLCGPARFMAELTAVFGALGFDADHLHTESFGTLAPSLPASSVGPTVRLASRTDRPARGRR